MPRLFAVLKSFVQLTNFASGFVDMCCASGIVQQCDLTALYVVL